MYVQNGLLLLVTMAGMIMLPGGVTNAITSAVAGRLYDNVGQSVLRLLALYSP